MSALQLSADFMPVTVLKISENSPERISLQLDASIAKAPAYFKHAPLVIDIGKMPRPQSGLDIQALCHLLREKDIIPIGVRGLADEELELAYRAGLAVLKQSDKRKTVKKSAETVGENNNAALPSLVTKIITHPVRAGTQVYAKGGDLVILSSVNAGAECLADGNIHVYGPLRGRALAGVHGNTQARIFCRSLEAELIAIAGYYWVSDEIPKPSNSHSGGLIHVFLEDSKLQLTEIQ